MNTNVDNNTNLTMDDIIPDLSLGWSFWIQICYDSPYNNTDKIYKNYYVGNCKNQQIMYTLVKNNFWYR